MEGDPGSAGAKSLPESRPETPSGSVSVSDESGYAPTDPKHEDFHSTMSDYWDNRSGK